ncbi:hypothetical protein [Microbacterium hydrocarbonoxydans]|uniref:hypothetical protein n=1 Tax=Microbacterium hydrocarbonoxydans TaxID=273678 RepID=UPI003D95AA6C
MAEEWAAFRSRLEESPIIAGKISPIVRRDKDGAVRESYIVAKSARPDRLRDARYTATPRPDSNRRYTWDVRVVAVDADGLDILGDAVLAQAVGHVLTVSGRVCDPIELVENVEEGDGYDRTTDLFFRDFSFRFWSRRA